MTILKRIVSIALLISTTATTILVASEDYALTEDYVLLNDMKLAKEQQTLIVSLSSLLEEDSIENSKIVASQKRFEKVLHGLTSGDKEMNLNGTTIPQIKIELSQLQSIWNESKILVTQAIIDKKKREEAIDSLNGLLIKMGQTVTLYNKSYNRYRQRSRLSFMVNRHMNSYNPIATLALNDF